MHIRVLSPSGAFHVLQTSFYGRLIWLRFKLRGVRGLENKLAGWHKVLGEGPALRWRSRKEKINPRDIEQKELMEHGEMKKREYIFKLFMVAMIEMFLYMNSPKVLWKRKQRMGLNLYTHAPLSPVVPGYLGPLLSFDLTISLTIITFYFPHLFLEKLSKSGIYMPSSLPHHPHSF